jgi:protein-disulfide isomerase
MKAQINAGAVALGLLLAGCGDNGNVSAPTANGQQAGLAQIPAPNHGDWTQIVSETPEGGYRMGNPDAPVKLVEYASITCPHCGEFAEGATVPLRDQYVHSGQVSWEYRPYMLFATDPGLFALLRCQGPTPFFQMIEQLYGDQQNWAVRGQQVQEQQGASLAAMNPVQRSAALIRGAGLDQFMRQRGMPQGRIDSCLADERNLQRVADDTARATNEQGVNGTPTFFINGTRQENVGTWQTLEPLLRTALGQ